MLLTNAKYDISELYNILKLDILCSDDTLKKAKEQRDCYARIKGFPLNGNYHSLVPEKYYNWRLLLLHSLMIYRSWAVTDTTQPILELNAAWLPSSNKWLLLLCKPAIIHDGLCPTLYYGFRETSTKANLSTYYFLYAEIQNILKFQNILTFLNLSELIWWMHSAQQAYFNLWTFYQSYWSLKYSDQLKIRIKEP